MIMQAEISNTRGEDSSRGIVTPITFLPSSFRSPPVGPQVTFSNSFHVHMLLSQDEAESAALDAWSLALASLQALGIPGNFHS